MGLQVCSKRLQLATPRKSAQFNSVAILHPTSIYAGALVFFSLRVLSLPPCPFPLTGVRLPIDLLSTLF